MKSTLTLVRKYSLVLLRPHQARIQKSHESQINRNDKLRSQMVLKQKLSFFAKLISSPYGVKPIKTDDTHRNSPQRSRKSRLNQYYEWTFRDPGPREKHKSGWNPQLPTKKNLILAKFKVNLDFSLPQ